ncbi:MAG: OsmC family protein [Candidatus Rokubacteria bacterium]|nr:OsmC family protein [Candidatus Rokubacteria bacterium]
MSGPPPITLQLTWQGELRFAGRSGDVELTLDGDRKAGPSPVQALAFALAGCMAIDVLHVLTKGRLGLEGLRARLTAERAPEEPRRLVKVDLHFLVTGDVPPDRVKRAIALSREKYCSVWHSLRQDIDFTTSYEIRRKEVAR